MEYEILTRNKDDVSESGETCLPANCCFSELVDILIMSSYVNCSHHDIAEKLFIWCWTTLASINQFHIKN